eukprot:TRINITY_DN16782_c0_g1_i1.p1 TRINITY_DN16782_c0_g1~~TRINITY_DN16782_c0_g1_i1.p1  ORF type:complete len:486 (+),score=94.59 TRINITY_DN16782_c0_g1_i1:237-1694(+)
MLLKITGDPHVMAGIRTDSKFGSNWMVDNTKPVGSAQQISNLLKILGLEAGNRGAGLPEGYKLYRGLSRGEKGEPIKLDKPPISNSLRSNDYIYIAYDPPPSPKPPAGGGGGDRGTRAHSPILKNTPGPNAFADKHPPQRMKRRHEQGQDFAADNEMAEMLLDKQRIIEELGDRLQAVEVVNRDLKRQVLQLTDELSHRRMAPQEQPHPVEQYFDQPPYSGGRSVSGSQPGSVAPQQDPEAVARLKEYNKQLQAELDWTKNTLRDVQLKLETLEAWKSQHDCSKTGTKPSDLRQEISQMKNTLRDVVREREETKEGLAIRQRELGERFHAQRASGDSMVKEAAFGIGEDGAQLMPAPYYMDPYTAPASVYQQCPGRSEGTICKLKVQTLTGEGTVIRRIYSAVTRNNQHVLILSSLEGVVTDEIAAAELEKAGVGYNRPDLLFLATAKHRWVLSMEPEDRKKWLDWLVQTNASLAHNPDHRQTML